MSSVRWNATVVDSPGNEPYAVVGDLVVAVRTPRSRNFVTVEVAPTSQSHLDHNDVVLSSRPYPWLDNQWQGEIPIGGTVSFSVAGQAYRLTLANLSECAAGQPWITCDFCVERE